MSILTAADDLKLHPSGSRAVATVVRYWPIDTPRVIPTSTHPRLRARAHVNHGRWIVACPFCRVGASLADEVDRRFFCVHCLHAGTDAERCWLRVEWPADSERARIEGYLLRRPLVNRNWVPGESPLQLLAENVTNGIQS